VPKPNGKKIIYKSKSEVSVDVVARNTERPGPTLFIQRTGGKGRQDRVLVVATRHREGGLPGRGGDVGASRTPVAHKILAPDNVAIENYSPKTSLALCAEPLL
jgi:hypothetical protein